MAYLTAAEEGDQIRFRGLSWPLGSLDRHRLHRTPRTALRARDAGQAVDLVGFGDPSSIPFLLGPCPLSFFLLPAGCWCWPELKLWLCVCVLDEFWVGIQTNRPKPWPRLIGRRLQGCCPVPSASCSWKATHVASGR